MAGDLAAYDAVPTELLRDRVMDDLVKHYSLDRLGLEEFERRSERISKAVTRGELLEQVADLPPIRPDAGEAAPRPVPAGKVYSGARESDAAVAIFGGSEIRGAWKAPRKLSSLCLFGGVDIDLRKAYIPEEGLTIYCACAFGGIEIVAPPGMRLEVRGIGVFGGFDRPHNEVDDPSAPAVFVEGFALFGGVDVKIKA